MLHSVLKWLLGGLNVWWSNTISIWKHEVQAQLRSSDGAVCTGGGGAGIFTPQVCHKSTVTYLDGKQRQHVNIVFQAHLAHALLLLVNFLISQSQENSNAYCKMTVMITFSQVVLSVLTQILSLNVLHHTLRKKQTKKLDFKSFQNHMQKKINKYRYSIM